MLPEIRQSDYLYAVPKFELSRDDIPDIAQELKGFHENFTDCFQQKILILWQHKRLRIKYGPLISVNKNGSGKVLNEKIRQVLHS